MCDKRKMCEFIESKFGIWLLSSIFAFILIVCAHFLMYHSILVSSLWCAPLQFITFYLPKLLLAGYVGTIPLVICGKVKLWSDKQAWILYGIFVLCLLLQVLVFYLLLADFGIHGGFSICSWLAKICICLILATPIFLLFNRAWSLLILVLCGLWTITEVVYFRANGFFLDGLSITLVGNLEGFWNAAFGYLKWYDFVVFLPALIFDGILLYFPKKKYGKRSLPDFLFVVGVALLLNLCSCIGLNCQHFDEINQPRPKFKNMIFNPISSYAFGMMTTVNKAEYLHKFSVLHAFFYDVREFFALTLFGDEKPNFSEQEINKISYFISGNSVHCAPTSKLIIVLVESLESWAVTPEIMPNLCRFIDEHENLLVANDCVSQRKAGSSADGQMIVNTGILPVNVGTVAFRYCYNVFPALSKCYRSSCGIFPENLSTWNQKQMSDAYGIDTNIVSTAYDPVLFPCAIEAAHNYDYVMAVTMSSNTPFVSWCDSSHLVTPNDMPILMQNYLKCINLMDEGLGILLDKMDTDTALVNATLVITGDHSIFNASEIEEFSDYARASEMKFDLTKHNSIAIISSPQITSKTIVDEVCYQLDIYPTILHLIGCDDYYWRGFGVNLLDSIARHHRPISPDEASALSDKMIRADYFRNYLSQSNNSTLQR